MIRVAFDIGGTFTDFVLHDSANGATLSLKVPTTPRDPSAAVIAGVERLLKSAGIGGENVDMVLHATISCHSAYWRVAIPREASRRPGEKPIDRRLVAVV